MNSYRDTSESIYCGTPELNSQVTKTAPGFGTVYKSKLGGRRFADLLDEASQIDPEIRFRFTSPHPKVGFSYNFIDLLLVIQLVEA